MNGPNLYGLDGLCARYLRLPASVTVDASGNATATFNPPLSAAEQVTFADLQALARSQAAMTPTDYNAIRAQMQVLRDLRQMTRATFTAQTQAVINRQVYDALVACCEVFLKLTRDT